MLNVSVEPGYKLLITLPLPRKHELRTVYRQGIPRPPRCYPVHALPLGGVKIIAGNFSLRTGCNGPLRQKVLANFQRFTAPGNFYSRDSLSLPLLYTLDIENCFTFSPSP